MPYVSQAVGLLRVTNSLRSFVRSEGIEPPTLWFEARCSNPLSYEREYSTKRTVKERIRQQREKVV